MVETDRLLGVSRVPVADQPPSIDPKKVAVVDSADALERETPMPSIASASSSTAASSPTSKKKVALLADLLERHNNECPLVKTMPDYTNIVFGEGDPDADLMFIGEAPGADEDATGRPFVGRAGKLLTKMIIAMGLSREEVYICNTLKMRPPNNATPTPEQIAQSAPFLTEQIEIVSPKVIVTLGAPSSKFVLQSKEGIGKLRGQFHKAAVPGLTAEIDVMPTYHPAFLLRSYTPENRKKVWSDLCMVLEHLGRELPKPVPEDKG